MNYLALYVHQGSVMLLVAVVNVHRLSVLGEATVQQIHDFRQQVALNPVITDPATGQTYELVYSNSPAFSETLRIGNHPLPGA